MFLLCPLPGRASGVKGGGSDDLTWPQDLCKDWRQIRKVLPGCLLKIFEKNASSRPKSDKNGNVFYFPIFHSFLLLGSDV